MLTEIFYRFCNTIFFNMENNITLLNVNSLSKSQTFNRWMVKWKKSSCFIVNTFYLVIVQLELSFTLNRITHHPLPTHHTHRMFQPGPYKAVK